MAFLKKKQPKDVEEQEVISIAEEKEAEDASSSSIAVEDEWNKVEKDREKYIADKEASEAAAEKDRLERERRRAIQLMNQRRLANAERNASIRMKQLLASMPGYINAMKRIPLDAPATDGFMGATRRMLKNEGKISKEELAYRQDLISKHNLAVNRVRALNDAALSSRNIIFSTRIPGVGYESFGFSRILITSILEDMVLSKHGFVLLADASDINHYDIHREGNGLTERIFDNSSVHIGFMDAAERWRYIKEEDGNPITTYCTRVAPASNGKTTGKSQSYWFMPGHNRVNPDDKSLRYLTPQIADGVVEAISKNTSIAVIDVSPEERPRHPKAASFFPRAFESPAANYMIVEVPVKHVGEDFKEKLHDFLELIDSTGFDRNRISFVIIPDGKIDEYMTPLMRMVASDILAEGYDQSSVTLINDNGSPAGIGTAQPKTAAMVRKMVDRIYGIQYNDDPPVV